jgi:tetratricopeptide (TPR) repeat protein
MDNRFALGFVLGRRGDLDEAVAAHRRAVELREGRNWQPLVALAEACSRAGRFDDAVQAARQALDLALLGHNVQLERSLHLVVLGATADADLRRFVSRAKQASGHGFAARTGLRLWQQGFFDHVVRGEEELRRAIAYCLANPVRAGLVESVEDWPLWGSSVYAREELLRFVEETGRLAPGRTD